MTGYDTAARIQDTYQPAHEEFGASPDYWIRYFHPSPSADPFNEGAVAESMGAWESGGAFVGCISAPVQSRLSGSAAEGQADAQAFAAALLSTYQAVPVLELPAANQLYCWLDQEYSTSLSPAYWNAWANYIAEHDFDGLGTYPLYPCLYCDPYSPYPNCTTIAKSKGVNIPSAVWSSEPEPCGSLTKPPQWKADTCATVPTRVWQFGEQDACNFSSNVDLNTDAPGFVTADYCFQVRSKPS